MQSLNLTLKDGGTVEQDKQEESDFLLGIGGDC